MVLLFVFMSGAWLVILMPLLALYVCYYPIYALLKWLSSDVGVSSQPNAIVAVTDSAEQGVVGTPLAKSSKRLDWSSKLLGIATTGFVWLCLMAVYISILEGGRAAASGELNFTVWNLWLTVMPILATWTLIVLSPKRLPSKRILSYRLWNLGAGVCLGVVSYSLANLLRDHFPAGGADARNFLQAGPVFHVIFFALWMFSVRWWRSTNELRQSQIRLSCVFGCWGVALLLSLPMGVVFMTGTLLPLATIVLLQIASPIQQPVPITVEV